MASYLPVCRVDDVIEGEGRPFRVGVKVIAVFRSGGRFFAIDDMCPHMGAPLSGGHVENDIVTCPWHAWRFRLTDGAWADSPRIKIGCYPVRVEGDNVLVELPSAPPPKEELP